MNESTLTVPSPLKTAGRAGRRLLEQVIRLEQALSATGARPVAAGSLPVACELTPGL
jgi:hypothetical protein